MRSNNASGVSVHDGFPNPATDSQLGSLDLQALLVPHPVSTYFMRAQGSDWEQLGIFSGDILVIDRSLTAGKNSLVVWTKDGTLTVSWRADMPVQALCWGVVTAAIHQYHRRGCGQ